MATPHSQIDNVSPSGHSVIKRRSLITRVATAVASVLALAALSAPEASTAAPRPLLDLPNCFSPLVGETLHAQRGFSCITGGHRVPAKKGHSYEAVLFITELPGPNGIPRTKSLYQPLSVATDSITGQSYVWVPDYRLGRTWYPLVYHELAVIDVSDGASLPFHAIAEPTRQWSVRSVRRLRVNAGPDGGAYVQGLLAPYSSHHTPCAPELYLAGGAGSHESFNPALVGRVTGRGCRFRLRLDVKNFRPGVLYRYRLVEQGDRVRIKATRPGGSDPMLRHARPELRTDVEITVRRVRKRLRVTASRLGETNVRTHVRMRADSPWRVGSYRFVLKSTFRDTSGDWRRGSSSCCRWREVAPPRILTDYFSDGSSALAFAWSSTPLGRGPTQPADYHYRLVEELFAIHRVTNEQMLLHTRVVAR